MKVIHALLPHLPGHHDYRVVLMQRDFREVVASQSRMLAEGSQDRAPVPDERLAEIFRQQHEETKALLDLEPHFEWIGVRHADLFNNDELTVRRICRFLGLSNCIKAMRECVDPSLYRERLDAAKPVAPPEA